MRVFDAFLPFLTSAVAIWAIAKFSITEERAHAVRLELERRRGAPEVVSS
jgi:GPH family glycoside/pentoside/hexuronide:cation symporter